MGVIKGVLDAAVFTTNPHNFPWATSALQTIVEKIGVLDGQM